MPEAKSKKAVRKAPSKRVSQKAKEPKGEMPVKGGFAVIETGGKQYRVSEGDSIKIEKIKNGSKVFKIGDSVAFDRVLLLDDGSGSTFVGTPYLDKAKVEGKIVEIGRNKKVTVIKYKQKSRYFKKQGHRQPYFKVQILKIS
jgi:large subunit ribosomal protein L21